MLNEISSSKLLLFTRSKRPFNCKVSVHPLISSDYFGSEFISHLLVKMSDIKFLRLHSPACTMATAAFDDTPDETSCEDSLSESASVDDQAYLL